MKRILSFRMCISEFDSAVLVATLGFLMYTRLDHFRTFLAPLPGAAFFRDFSRIFVAALLNPELMSGIPSGLTPICNDSIYFH